MTKRKRLIWAGFMACAFFTGGIVAQLLFASPHTVQADTNRYTALGWGNNDTMDKLWVLDTNTGDVNYFSLSNMKDSGPTRTFFFKKTP